MWILARCGKMYIIYADLNIHMSTHVEDAIKYTFQFSLFLIAGEIS